MPPQRCTGCKCSFNGINGLYCGKLHRYIQYAHTVQCGAQQEDNDMNNNEMAIMRPESMKEIIMAAPGAYDVNKTSRDNCVNAGQHILHTIQQQGMTDELDKQAAVFIEKARRTVKVMNERRSPVTKLFDEMRSHFTTIENEIDPAKSGTIGYQLQQLRNQYAAKKRAEEEKRRQEALARQRAKEARRKYRADVEEDMKRQFDDMVNTTVNTLTQLDNAVTLANFGQQEAGIKAVQKELPTAWLDGLKSNVRIPLGVDIAEVKAVEKETKDRLSKQFSEQYAFEVGGTVDYILDRLPSKKANLERIVKADAEEAARIKAEMEARQKAEAERIEKERLAREAEAKAKAEMDKQAGEMTSLFNQQATVAGYQPKTKVTKKIQLLNPEGIMPIISLWWSKEGCTLSVDELAKMFKKQIVFCEKLANKDGVFVNDESVEYVDEVKAK